MLYCLFCAGESSMAMAIGKFLLLQTVFTFSQNNTVIFIYRISADLLKTAFLCYLLELVELQCSPEDLERLEHFYVSHSCSQGDRFFLRSWCYCNTYCTPPIFRQVSSGQLHHSASPPDSHSRYYYSIRTAWIGFEQLCYQPCDPLVVVMMQIHGPILRRIRN